MSTNNEDKNIKNNLINFPQTGSLLALSGSAAAPAVIVDRRSIGGKMAVSRRSSQHQQSTLQPSPRNAAIASPPPESPSAIIPDSASLLSPSATGAGECGGATTETAAASASSPDRPAPAATAAALGSSSCSSISSSATAGSQSPGSGATSPGEVVCGAGGAFRELFEACRNGDVSRVKRLVDSVNVNAKDMAGRKSTPLHFAAGLCVLFS